MLGVSSEFTEGSTSKLNRDELVIENNPTVKTILTSISLFYYRWADLGYKKSHSGSKWKKPFAESSHASGIVVEKVAVEAKQPNSAVRKCVRVQLKKNNKRITAYVPRDGGMSFIDENDDVLVAGFGRSGHAKGDLPGVRFKIVKVAGCGLNALWSHKKEKPVH
jgi:small subunit ribosomal protein S23e